MSFSRHGVTEETVSGVHVSPGSAETLVQRGGIANHQSIAYSLSNITAKNYQNRLMCVGIVVCYMRDVYTLSILLQSNYGDL